MRQVRKGTFETNSSSTHSMVIAMTDDYAMWKDMDGFVDYDDRIVSREEAQSRYEEYVEENPETELSFEDWVNSWESELWDYDTWHDNLERDTHEFVTTSGDRVIIRCAYGYD